MNFNICLCVNIQMKTSKDLIVPASKNSFINFPFYRRPPIILRFLSPLHFTAFFSLSPLSFSLHIALDDNIFMLFNKQISKAIDVNLVSMPSRVEEGCCVAGRTVKKEKNLFNISFLL